MQTMEEWILGLRQSNKLILVEGQNDKKALQELGISNMLTVSRIPIYKIVETIQAKEVIILTDLDKEGRKYYAQLRHHLQRKGIKIDTQFREFLLKETNITQIEGLPHYLRKTVATASKIG